jgi:hypothetical protein
MILQFNISLFPRHKLGYFFIHSRGEEIFYSLKGIMNNVLCAEGSMRCCMLIFSFFPQRSRHRSKNHAPPPHIFSLTTFLHIHVVRYVTLHFQLYGGRWFVFSNIQIPDIAYRYSFIFVCKDECVPYLYYMLPTISKRIIVRIYSNGNFLTFRIKKCAFLTS